MFTGLIEHLGTVRTIVHDAGGCTLTISDSAPILGDCHIGDSIAVNGACLTVTAFEKEEGGGWFTVWLANETLERTDLGERREGEQVGVVLGGWGDADGLQAHVDTTATVLSKTSDGDSLRMVFQLEEETVERPSLLPYLITKGYVTIDGASLTLTGVDDAARTFAVMLIQHTQTKITLAKKEVGAKVNVEADMVGKYVGKGIAAALGGGGDAGLRELVERVVEAALFVEIVVCMEPTLKRKVTVKLTYTEPSPSKPPPNRSNIGRSASPTKSTVDGTLRPRAKINSSAQPIRKTPSSRPGTSDGPTPRAVSPARVTTLSPTFQPKVRPTAYKAPPKSTPTTPHSRPRAPASEIGRLRSRQSSVTLHHAASVSSFPVSSTSTTSASPSPSDIDGRYSPSPQVRIKSKVTTQAKPDSLSPPPLSAPSARIRAPSVSSSISARPPPAPAPAPAPPQTFYPITTAVPAANPHRYAPRSPPVPAPHFFQPFRPQPDPEPAPSPPASALSFSSRSSVSVGRSNVSAESGGDEERLRSTLDKLLRYTDNTPRDDTHSGDSGQDREDPDDTDDDGASVSALNGKAEAKSNRKIADLEITNRSLLAINASLERSKHKQAKEIRELRRKLRESRLILPPRAFRAVSSPSSDNIDEEDESSDDEAGEGGDETYARIKAIVEALLDTGRRALETEERGGAKVLSAYADAEEVDPAHIAVPESEESELGSEDEVEMTLTSALGRESESPPPVRARTPLPLHH
ncbi:hypothetical protein DXG01_009640 [Tephrocybe rancida]|nr:hypothetical protein DXG01_009640 [Tephrocybe rancida]